MHRFPAALHAQSIETETQLPSRIAATRRQIDTWFILITSGKSYDHHHRRRLSFAAIRTLVCVASASLFYDVSSCRLAPSSGPGPTVIVYGEGFYTHGDRKPA